MDKFFLLCNEHTNIEVMLIESTLLSQCQRRALRFARVRDKHFAFLLPKGYTLFARAKGETLATFVSEEGNSLRSCRRDALTSLVPIETVASLVLNKALASLVTKGVLASLEPKVVHLLTSCQKGTLCSAPVGENHFVLFI